MKLVEEAVERIKPYLVVAAEDATTDPYRSDENYGYFDGKTTAEVTRLRFDWEISKETSNETTNSDVVSLLCQQFAEDLSDLIENGDMEETQDVLLQNLNGSRKRGKQPDLVDIFEAHVFQESKKDVVVYTLYILLAVRWPED